MLGAGPAAVDGTLRHRLRRGSGAASPPSLLATSPWRCLPVLAGPRLYSAAAGAVHPPGLLSQGLAPIRQHREQQMWGLQPLRERQAWQHAWRRRDCAWPWLQQRLHQLPHTQPMTWQASQDSLPARALPLLAAGMSQARAMAPKASCIASGEITIVLADTLGIGLSQQGVQQINTPAAESRGFLLRGSSMSCCNNSLRQGPLGHSG